MKKVESVSISGYLYFIDADAFEVLENYFKSFEKKYGKTGESELLQDIENRISEIFSEKANLNSKVVNIEMVRSMISQIGTVSSIDAECSSKPNFDKLDEQNVSAEFDKVVQGSINIAKTVFTKTSNAMQELSQKMENSKKGK